MHAKVDYSYSYNNDVSAGCNHISVLACERGFSEQLLLMLHCFVMSEPNKVQAQFVARLQGSKKGKEE